MKLSIITINYNNASGLRRTLASVAAQSYKDIEHIIVDAASTDGSVDVIKEYVRENKKYEVKGKSVIWVSEPDKGIYDGMNKGIKRATGDYIQVLNSGDILASDAVTERMMRALAQVKSEEIGILYGNMLRDFGNGKTNRDTCLGESRTSVNASQELRAQEVEWTMDDFIKGTVNHDPTYIHRSLYEKYGLYDENLRICSDWKWFVNAVVFGGEKLFYVPIDVTIFDTTGISEKNLESREKERHAELEKMLPAAILKDYDRYHFPISQYKRLKKHHLWGLVYILERVLFKLEKWKLLR